MRLFGKKQKDGEKLPKKKEKPKKAKNKFSYKTPGDVKLFLQLPIVLVVGIMLIFTGVFLIHKNATAYRAQVMASSMKYGEELPLWGGTSRGKLTLGHTKLSKDGKDLAVEIKYDDEAHKGLSSFGNRYKLRLVDTYTEPVKGVKMSYGLFGTDGSGVLQIKSSKPLKNRAFIVMIIDNGHLVSDEDLSNSSQMSDGDLDESITSQLANGDTSTSNSGATDTSEKARKLPPLYFVRLNAANASRNYRNWNSDTELVDDLFVDGNLKKIQKQLENTQVKIKRAKRTLGEMQERLAENKNDQVAVDGVTNLKSSISGLETEYKSLEKNYEKLKNANLSSNILNPKQTKYHQYTIKDLNVISE